MKIKDQVAWSDHELELQQDEAGRRFHEFFLAWFGRAESLYQESEASLISAVRDALLQEEAQCGEVMSMEWIGQMLLVATAHWEYGDALVNQLSPLEARMLQQMAGIKMAELQLSAEESANL